MFKSRRLASIVEESFKTLSFGKVKVHEWLWICP